jgi:hypothetical protein
MVSFLATLCFFGERYFELEELNLVFSFSLVL